MYTDDDLHEGIKAGIFTKDSVSKFRHYISESKHTHAVDEENLKLISGFNDIFVSIASLLVLFAAAWLGSQLSEPIGFIISAGISWFLSTHFILQKKLALPAIIYLLTFVGSISGFVIVIIPSPFMLPEIGVNYFHMILASIAGILAAYVHWRKFKVPIAIAMGVGGLIIYILSIITQIPILKNSIPLLTVLAGIATFMLAMYWDKQDLERKTKQSDIAFWLHLMSAALIVHPIFYKMQWNMLNTMIAIFIYMLLGFISVIINRRSLMVSSLAYILYAFMTLFKTYSTIKYSFALASVLIGCMLLLLSAFWYSIRIILLQYIPNKFKQYLPPV